MRRRLDALVSTPRFFSGAKRDESPRVEDALRPLDLFDGRTFLRSRKYKDPVVVVEVFVLVLLPLSVVKKSTAAKGRRRDDTITE